ncbi:hypothetical protein [Frankia sp. Cas3]|uniref:hypothetical protein n=1 Tax=Frankia sp. Cas3 TaxID=3073926 RepID=UPI002AD4F341|nr:hypothetical protein [Frankia sp. Cas3]
MSSHTLLAWQTTRRERVEELCAVRQLAKAGGTAREEQVDWALTLRLAAEFQGFARDLHNLTANIYVSRLAGARTASLEPLRLLFTSGRALDRGNAHPGALGADFARFGLTLWPTLEATNLRASSWNAALGQLNAARNAVAHDNPGEIADLVRRGCPPTLASVERWRSSLDELAETLDDVLATFIEATLGPPRPW